VEKLREVGDETLVTKLAKYGLESVMCDEK